MVCVCVCVTQDHLVWLIRKKKTSDKLWYQRELSMSDAILLWWLSRTCFSLKEHAPNPIAQPLLSCKRRFEAAWGSYSVDVLGEMLNTVDEKACRCQRASGEKVDLWVHANYQPISLYSQSTRTWRNRTFAVKVDESKTERGGRGGRGPLWPLWPLWLLWRVKCDWLSSLVSGFGLFK